jgi:hypothetical protein
LIVASGIFGPPFWDQNTATPKGDDIFRPPTFFGTGPTFLPNPWDTVVLDGKALPGKCSIRCEPQVRIDEKKPPGVDGARLTLLGYLPGPIEISIVMWTQAQWEEYVGRLPKIWRLPNKASANVKATAKLLNISLEEAQLWESSHKIYHPSLEGLGVHAVVIKGISTPEDGPIPQSKLVRIRCVHFIDDQIGFISPRKVGGAPVAPLDPSVDFAAQRAKNSGLRPPSDTDMGPKGPKPDLMPGSG